MSVLRTLHLRAFLVTFPHPLLHLSFSIGSLYHRAAHDRKTDAASAQCCSASCGDSKGLILTVAPQPLFYVPSSGLMAIFHRLWERLLSSESYSPNTVIVQAFSRHFSKVVYVTNGFSIANRPFTVIQSWTALASPFGPSKVSRGASKGFPNLVMDDASHV
ncbi:hypothetical protein C8J57DRAFT_1236751 [Mycena rebaudengoi]|nr:hypothetical protein C8J57DRAFT_1236751 [Mycena rebaudengoi]